MHFSCALILALTASQVAPQADRTGRIAGRITVEVRTRPWLAPS